MNNNNSSLRQNNFQPPRNNAGPPPNNTSKQSKSEYDVFKIVAIIVVMILIVIVTFWIINKMKQGDKSETRLVDDVYIQMDDKSKLPLTINSDVMPSSALGNEYTYNFWIYLSDNYEATTDHKVVMYRGEKEDSSNMNPITLKSFSSPIVAMDKSTNKMHIAVATKNVSRSYTLQEIFSASTDSVYLKTTIDYVPLQRWVNVTLMIIDNILRVYLDGDIYSVVSTSEMTGTPSIKLNESDLVIGHSGKNIHGFFANPRYFNHSIAQNKIRSIYKKGPITRSWLSYIGLGKYGFQSPVYKIDS